MPLKYDLRCYSVIVVVNNLMLKSILKINDVFGVAVKVKFSLSVVKLT